MSIIRKNLIYQENYSPYCGSASGFCSLPRTYFDGKQFICRNCGWNSAFPPEFIAKYKKKWGKE